MVKAWQLDIGSTICGERHGTSNAHLGLRHCLEEGHFATGGGVNFYLRFRPHNFWADLVSWAPAIALPTISKVHLSPAHHVTSSCPVVLCPHQGDPQSNLSNSQLHLWLNNLGRAPGKYSWNIPKTARILSALDEACWFLGHFECFKNKKN